MPALELFLGGAAFFDASVRESQKSGAGDSQHCALVYPSRSKCRLQPRFSGSHPDLTRWGLGEAYLRLQFLERIESLLPGVSWKWGLF